MTASDEAAELYCRLVDTAERMYPEVSEERREAVAAYVADAARQRPAGMPLDEWVERLAARLHRRNLGRPMVLPRATQPWDWAGGMRAYAGKNKRAPEVRFDD